LSKFTDWEFLLNGDTQDFRQRVSKPSSFYFNIYGGVDHWLDCPNDDFRMTSIYCDNETDPQVVWQIGYELISLFNGASILISKNYRKVSIFKLQHKESEVDFCPQKNISALLGKPSVNQRRISEAFNNVAISDIQLALIHFATENQDVYFLLKYLGMGSSWTTYYKLMEAVETFAKDKNIDLETVNNSRKAFTNTANNFSLSGFDSRHGFKEKVNQNNTKSMSIDEGYNFVTSMIKIYLNKEYFQGGEKS